MFKKLKCFLASFLVVISLSSLVHTNAAVTQEERNYCLRVANCVGGENLKLKMELLLDRLESMSFLFESRCIKISSLDASCINAVYKEYVDSFGILTDFKCKWKNWINNNIRKQSMEYNDYIKDYESHIEKLNKEFFDTYNRVLIFY